MRKSSIVLAGLTGAALLIAVPAQARGYYFNKPGVSREAYMADVAECIELAGGVRPGSTVAPYSPNLVGALAGAFFAGMSRGRERRRLIGMVERTCMADKGYSRFEVGDDVLDGIEDLPNEADRLERLFRLASEAEPVGRRMSE
jgi:hypothetical protein